MLAITEPMFVPTPEPIAQQKHGGVWRAMRAAW
jgi:hypothetical protein